MSTNARENRAVIYNYQERKKQHIELDTAPYYVVPLFRIGEVAKFLQRSTETLRKYEQLRLIPKARKFQTGRSFIRLYTEDDVMDLADFFALRNLPGRPEKTNSKIDRVFLKKSLSTRFKEIK